MSTQRRSPAPEPSRPDISRITDLLYISAWPEEHHAPEIAGLGIRLIITMHWLRPHKALGTPPGAVLRLPAIDSPLTPISMRLLLRGVQTALPVLQAGHGVLVHCQYGRHRSVAMACAILIAQGMAATDAMGLVKERRPVADPDIWYIAARIRRFEEVWRALERREAAPTN
jgi:protein tyrosine phosphatase (PTP) superfamily phosphohydrolase (DUF442 family)